MIKFENEAEFPLEIEKCVQCDSRDIAITSYGYTCRKCGLVNPESQLFNDKISNRIFNPGNHTKIGFNKERFCIKSTDFYKLSKLDKIREHEYKMLELAKIEASRIFYALDLPLTLQKDVILKFIKIRKKLKVNTKFRSPEKLIPIITYLCLKLKTIVLEEDDLIEISKISRKEFNAVKLQLQLYLPEYLMRDRKNYISKLILRAFEGFNLSSCFYLTAFKFLDKFWERISLTKDTVIAALISTLTFIALDNKTITINSICNKLKVRMCTVDYQIKKHIADYYNIREYKSLVKSRNIIRDFLRTIHKFA